MDKQKKQFKNRSKADSIFDQLHFYLKSLQKQNQLQSQQLGQFIKDKKRILKLFNYQRWGQFMNWVNEKLQQSGQDIIFTQTQQKQRQQQLSQQRQNDKQKDNIQIKTNKKNSLNNKEISQNSKPINKIIQNKLQQQNDQQKSNSNPQDVLSQIVEEAQQDSMHQTINSNLRQDQIIQGQQKDHIKIVQSINLNSVKINKQISQKSLAKQKQMQQENILLATKNAKLRKQVIQLKDKLISYQNILRQNGFKKN